MRGQGLRDVDVPAIIEFKLAKSFSLKLNVQKQVELYEIQWTRKSVKVIICYSGGPS